MRCDLSAHREQLLAYLELVITEGDWLNDFLTHLPLECQPVVQHLGEWLAILL
jgi:hypothetical protein